MISDFIDGPLWFFSLTVFCVGEVWKLSVIVFSSRQKDLSVARDSAVFGAITTIFSRFVQDKGTAPRIKLQIIAERDY